VENWSRARLQRLIEDSTSWLTAASVKSSYKTRPQDEIEIELTSLPVTTFAPEEIPIEIVHETTIWWSLTNRPGWWFIRAAALLRNTRQRAGISFPRTLGVGRTVRRELSTGWTKALQDCSVVAKTEAAHENLSDQFRAREISNPMSRWFHGQMERKRARSSNQCS
jgi:hypothetical protein